MGRETVLRRSVSHALVYVTILTAALAQPLLQLYGGNLAMFAAADMQGAMVLWFMAVVLLGPPLTLWLVEAVVSLVRPTWQTRTHHVLVFLGFWGFVNLLTRDVSVGPWPVGLAVTALVAAALVVLYAHRSQVRTWLKWMSPLALAVAVLFTLAVRDVVWVPEVVALELKETDRGAVISGGTSKSDVSVVWLILDEFPLFSLLDENGKVNAERYPGFGKLAASSTWYRNLLATSQTTTDAVPAMLTGMKPKQGGSPVLASHPKNLFTLMNGHLSMDAHEVVTALCPKDVCKTVSVSGGEDVANPATTTTSTPEAEQTVVEPSAELGPFLRDASVVLGHKILPKGLRDRLPAIDENWGGFGQGGAFNEEDLLTSTEDRANSSAGTDDAPTTTSDDEGSEVLLDAKKVRVKDWQEGGPVTQVQTLLDVADRAAQSSRPTLHFVHALLPHRPWELTPDLRKHKWLGSDKKTGTVLDTARDEYQEFLMQAAATDSLVDNLVTKLQRSANWNRTMLVVTSDHGMTFELGEWKRKTVNPKNVGSLEDIYRAPLFIKYPDQTEPKVDDCPVSGIDVLPTVAAATGIDAGWTFDGVDLGVGCPSRTSREVLWLEGKTTITSGSEAVTERARVYSNWVGSDFGVDGIAAVTPYARLLGTAVTPTTKDQHITAWSPTQQSIFKKVPSKQFSMTPMQVDGRIRIAKALPKDAVGLFLVDGKVAGFIGELSGARAGNIYFRTILSQSSMTPGAHSISLAIAVGDPSDPTITRGPAPSRP